MFAAPFPVLNAKSLQEKFCILDQQVQGKQLLDYFSFNVMQHNSLGESPMDDILTIGKSIKDPDSTDFQTNKKTIVQNTNLGISTSDCSRTLAFEQKTDSTEYENANELSTVDVSEEDPLDEYVSFGKDGDEDIMLLGIQDEVTSYSEYRFAPDPSFWGSQRDPYPITPEKLYVYDTLDICSPPPCKTVLLFA
jgi:hypothetical protein